MYFLLAYLLSPALAGLPALPRKFCQPGRKCWPTVDDIKTFSDSINGSSNSCLGLKKLIDVEDAAAHTKRCKKYTGLKSGKRDANPFTTGAHYNKKKESCMTPYQFLNNRNYKNEWMAAFIVTTDNPKDIQKAIRFAKKHTLGISVMSTGHDFQDRNAGPGPNSLLIRTTCFTKWESHPTDHFKGHHGAEWKDGYAVVGAGLTFGENFWTSIPHSQGIYGLAAIDNREIAGGTCPSNGVVGWTLGGGIGWITPWAGYGIDQLLEAEVVLADGTITTASFKQNRKLFWALRGGGGGFAVITSLTVKLHKPRCGDGNMTNCYTKWKATWSGTYDNQTIDIVTHITRAWMEWMSLHNRYWFSSFDTDYVSKHNTWTVSISAMYTGWEDKSTYSDYWSFNTTVQSLTFPNTNTAHSVHTTSKYWCETFDGNGTCEKPDVWPLGRWPQSIRFQVDRSTSLKKKGDNLVDTLIRYWKPLCDEFSYGNCIESFTFTSTQTWIDSKTGKSPFFTDGCPFPPGDYVFMVTIGPIRSSKKDLTIDEMEEWSKKTLPDALYKFTDFSLFNLAEYTLNPGQWESRFWGEKNHRELLSVKKKYDPELMFKCHHCIGDEVGYKP